MAPTAVRLSSSHAQSSALPALPARGVRFRPQEVTIVLKQRPWQRPLIKYFRDGGTRASVIAHRRAGKDRAALFIELEQAVRSPREVWHCLPSYKQARKVIWDAITGDGQRLIEQAFPPAIVKRRHEDEMKIELVNGSLWRLVGADNFDSLVGTNPRHVTFSEYALTAPNAYEFVRPILAENGGTALFITTPRGYNHAYRMHQYAANHDAWYAAIHPVSETGLITEERLAEERASMPEELYAQEYECSFSASGVGSILGRYIEQAEAEGRIGASRYDAGGSPIHVVADIGYRDAAAFWFVQPQPGGFAVIDHDEATKLDAEQWIERLRARGWTIGTLWLPHDARARTFATRRTVVETFTRAGLAKHVRVVPDSKIADRVNAARVFIRRCAFDEAACAQGLLSLREWAFKYDAARRDFSSEPDHDEHSHTADAFSYAALALGTVQPEAHPIESGDMTRYSFTLDDLHEAHRNG